MHRQAPDLVAQFLLEFHALFQVVVLVGDKALIPTKIQFRSNNRPWLKDLSSYPLELEREDPRTPEEIEQDLMHEAEESTEPMFGENSE